jgi:uncharacterized protein (TIGR03067 family)
MRKSLLLLVVASLAFAPAPFPRAGKRGSNESDLKKMQGRWDRVGLGTGEKPRPSTCLVTITGTRMQFPAADDAWVLTLGTTSNPKWLDAKRVNNPNSLFRGIYKFEGDALIIYWRGPDANPARPTDFTPGQPGVWYQVFKRVKR